MPKKNFPDIYGLIRQLAQILPPKIKKMDGVYREAFGMGMLKDVASLTKIYFKMANGRMPEELAREEMFLEIDNITAVLAIADENQLFDLITRTKIGETLVDLKAKQLTLHPKKRMIRKIEQGVPFLGAVVYPNHIVPGKRITKNTRIACEEVMAGVRGEESIVSYLGHAKYLNSARMLKRNFYRVGWEYNV